MGTIFPKRAPARGPALRAGFAIISPGEGQRALPARRLTFSHFLGILYIQPRCFQRGIEWAALPWKEAGSEDMKQYASLRDYVYKYIAHQIQTGALKPNQKLNEAQICTDLDISRTPAREALIKLASENVLNYTPRKGFTVREVDDEYRGNVYSVLAVLDAYAAELALPNMRPEDISKMREIIDKLDVAIKYHNLSDYNTLQQQFHQVYIDRCNNSFLVKTTLDIRNSFVPMVRTGGDEEELFQWFGQLNAQHRIIVDLFEQKKKDELIHFLRSEHWES